MKKNLLLLLVLCLTLQSLQAAYFRNQPYQVKQPDGTTINCFASGDEFFNWLHDPDGYTIIQAENGYYYYGVTSGDLVIPSAYLVNSVNPADAGLSKWVKISLNEYNKRKDSWFSHEKKGPKAPHLGTLNNLAIYIRFQDDAEFSIPRSQFDAKFNPSSGYTLKSYYTEVSYNSLLISTTHYPDCPMTTNYSYQDFHNRSYFQPYNATTNPNGYADNTARTEREHALLMAAVNWVNTNSPVPDSLNIDGDDDGNVDNVCFIIEGGNDAWAELLWAHRWFLFSYDVEIHGKRVWDYTFQPQSQVDPVTLCHEMFHSLGAPDLYHYSYDGFVPAGDWDLMESGKGHMGAYMKWKYAGGAWITDLPQITKPGVYWLKPLTSQTGNCYQIPSPYSAEQFFVVEYRKKTGTFEGTLPGSGLLVYRIDPSVGGNASGPPDEVYIYRPGGTHTANGNTSFAYFSAGAARTAINDATNPASFLQDGSAGGLNISKVGEAGDSICFTVKLSIIKDPAAFTSEAAGTSEVDLHWKMNTSGNPVMIAFSLNPDMGFPEDGTDYPVGSEIPGGGTVICNGTDTTFSHTGLLTNTTYYYTAWSVTGDKKYSPGLFSSSTTLCEPQRGLPFTEGFEDASTTLSCWTQGNADPAWDFIKGNGTGAGYGFPGSAHSGEKNALLKTLSDAGKINTLFSPVIDLTGFIDVQLKFWLFMKSWGSRQDELKVLYRNDPSETWNLLESYTSSVGEWTEETISLPVVSSRFQLAFQGDAKHGFGVCIDDVEITGTSTYTMSVAPESLNVTPAADSSVLTVSSNTEWTATSDAGWCSVTPSGSGDGHIVATYTENEGTESRTANISVTGFGVAPRTVVLTQRAKGVSVDEKAGRKISLYPNPTGGKFVLSVHGITETTTSVLISDVTGRVIYRTGVYRDKDNIIELPACVPGFYLVTIGTGNEKETRQLVITK